IFLEPAVALVLEYLPTVTTHSVGRFHNPGLERIAARVWIFRGVAHHARVGVSRSSKVIGSVVTKLGPPPTPSLAPRRRLEQERLVRFLPTFLLMSFAASIAKWAIHMIHMMTRRSYLQLGILRPPGSSSMQP